MKMVTVVRILCTGALLAAFILPSLSHQRRHRLRSIKADVSAKKISRQSLPAEVLSAFKEKYSTATISGQLREKREGVVYYEIESVDSAKHRDVLFLEDGTIVEIAESISPGELPSFVRDSVGTKYPDVPIVSAERSTRNSHVEYELELKLGRKTIAVIVNPNGKIFKLR